MWWATFGGVKARKSDLKKGRGPNQQRRKSTPGKGRERVMYGLEKKTAMGRKGVAMGGKRMTVSKGRGWYGIRGVLTT